MLVLLFAAAGALLGTLFSGQAFAEQEWAGSKTSTKASPWLKKTANYVARFEGYYPRCYDHVDGHATIGYGHLLHFGPCTKKDKKLYWSKQGAKFVLQEQLREYAKDVRRLVDVPTNGYMIRALTSFSYNVGVYGFQTSTLREKLNNNDYKGAARQFKRWNKGPGGVVMPGLTKRRKSEVRMFRKGGGLICPLPLICYKVFS